MISDAPVLT